jgi:hypothetical protein
MHAEIARVHPSIAAAMTYVDHSAVELERLDAERRLEAKRTASEN